MTKGYDYLKPMQYDVGLTSCTLELHKKSLMMIFVMANFRCSLNKFNKFFHIHA